MSGYTRQSTADIIPTAVVRAAPINAELNKLRDAFDFDSAGNTGHKHDGSADEGSYVPLIADLDANNKLEVDASNNRFGVFVEVSSNPVEQVRFQDGVIVPVTDNDIDLGTSGVEFKNLYLDGTANVDTLQVDENATITGNLIVNGNTTLGDAATDTVTITADVASNIIPSADNTYDLGAVGSEWKDLFIDGTATIDTLTVDENATVAGTLGVTGATTLSSTLAVTGNTTLSANLSVNGNTTVGNANTDTVTFTARAASNFLPTADNTYDLGSSSLEWKDLYLDGTAKVDILTVDESATIASNLSVGGNTSTTGNNTIGGNLSVSGNTTLGNAATDTVTITADVASNVIPSADSTYSLGDSSNYWSHGYLDAITTTGNVTVGGALSVATTLDMTSGQINNLATPSLSSDAATKGYVDTAISNVIDSAPGALDTLNELAAALGDDANFSTTVTNSLATKLNLSGGTMTGNIAMGGNTVTGLATPVNTSDAATKGYIDTTFGSTASAAASAAAAEAAFDSFDDRYLGAKSSAPATDNDGDALITGALYFDTTASLMKVYDGASWVDAGSAVNGTAERFVYTATASQTTFSATYDVGFVDVYLNGVKLVAGTDFTATNGTSIVLTTGATNGDIVDIVAYGAFSVANTYTQAAADAKFLQVTNNLSDLNDAPTALTNLGLTATAAELNVLDGITADVNELNLLDGVTATTAELNYLDITSLGTSEASKAVTTDANGVTIFDGGIVEDDTSITSSSGTATINCRDGNVFSHTLTEDVTYTFSNAPASGRAFGFTLKVVQDSTARTITWPASVDWPAATAPTLSTGSGEVDVFVFFTTNGGTTFYGFTAGQVLS